MRKSFHSMLTVRMQMAELVLQLCIGTLCSISINYVFIILTCFKKLKLEFYI